MLSLVCGGFGVLLLLLVASALREAATMRRWPVAPGRILSSAVEEYQATAGAGDFGSARSRMRLYRAVVVYEYTAAGHVHRGDRVAQSPGLNRGAPEFARRIVDRYPVGRTVEVRFNPRRPEEAVLEPRVPAGWILVLVMALALLVLAVYVRDVSL